MWAAVVARDRRADGRFWYSVRTTGVYCRPSCASRRPRRENVQFHEAPAAAEQAGFRPCRRCRPDLAAIPTRQRHADVVAHACRAIERSVEPLPLARLARLVGLSPHHFQRVFRAATGITPAEYAAAHRARRVRGHLRRSESVTDAIHDAGFGSSGRFYAEADAILGMKPAAYRDGGRDTVIRHAVALCSLGSVLVASSGRGVCAILLGDDPAELVRDLHERFPRATFVDPDSAYDAIVGQVVAMVDDPASASAIDLPLDVRGTVFQQRVWAALRRIPAGSTASYTDIAAMIGAPRAVRGVASACAANPLAVAIPCHRVVRRDGDLAGYRWGIARKRALLTKERTPPRAR
jgi:AraC family transcriptional regulator of adaptative response/methylated-DNA-[protein]-cysteine methyltransferase